MNNITTTIITTTINALTIVHCPECQAINHIASWEFRGCGDGPPQTQCWNWMAGCEAWFDPNWEADLAIDNQIARDEIRAECISN